jgi:hypothetical protein
MAEAAGGEPERLLFGIDVMEVQGCCRAVISACSTAPASLFDQDPLDSAPALGDPFLGAQDAAVGAPPVEAEDCTRVAATYAHDFPWRRCRVRPGQP